MQSEQALAHADLEAVGVFGTYGRGDAGVDSYLDLLLVYSRAEWATLPQWNPKLAEVLARGQGQLGITAAQEDQATGAFPFHHGLEGRTEKLRSPGDAAQLLGQA